MADKGQRYGLAGAATELVKAGDIASGVDAYGLSQYGSRDVEGGDLSVVMADEAAGGSCLGDVIAGDAAAFVDRQGIGSLASRHFEAK